MDETEDFPPFGAPRSGIELSAGNGSEEDRDPSGQSQRMQYSDAKDAGEARRLLAAIFAAKPGFESDVLLESKPSLHALTVLKQVGKLMSQIEPEPGTMTAARVLYALPIAWALVYHRTRITSHPGAVLAKAMRDAERVSAFTPNAALFGVAAVVAGDG
jgi:hypothetical protein